MATTIWSPAPIPLFNFTPKPKPPNRISIRCNNNNNNNNNGVNSEVKKNNNPLGLGSTTNKRDGNSIRWQELLYPDGENLVAVALAGVLASASVYVIFQIFLISTAILLAAIKYSLIAALLIFILITLL